MTQGNFSIYEVPLGLECSQKGQWMLVENDEHIKLLTPEEAKEWFLKYESKETWKEVLIEVKEFYNSIPGRESIVTKPHPNRV
jgi:hypothetical protein